MGFIQRDYNGEEILLPNTVLGYRQWYWNSMDKLTSHRNTKWTNGSITSVCKRMSILGEKEVDNHASPDQDCSCGIYAHYLPLESYDRNSNVFGVVEASGRILMGTKGFRAEKAKVVALAGLGMCNHWFEVKKPGESYLVKQLVDFCTSIGVPYFSTVEEMVHQFPQVDLQSLGVPDLSSWQESRNTAKELYETREKEAQERLLQQKAFEEELFKRHSYHPGGFLGYSMERYRDTFNHLGGYS